MFAQQLTDNPTLKNKFDLFRGLIIAISTSVVTTLIILYLVSIGRIPLPQIGGSADNLITRTINREVVNEESAVTSTVEKVNPAVVAIIISKNLPVYERRYNNYNPFGPGFFDDYFGFSVPEDVQNGYEKQDVGGGSGFIATSDGLVITNKHVVSDEEAEYTVVTTNDKKYTATVVARHPSTDLAILRIKPDGKLATIELGSSDNLKLGQTVIAIGNALAEFKNTVSLGVISGLSRSITAGDYTQTELLEGVIQTDAAINPGNSGGPLINLSGQVVGINTAIAQGGQNIGFAIPVEVAIQALDSVEKTGKITRPYIGVRYVLITPELKQKNKLPFDYGALIQRGETSTDLAVVPGSPADKAGITENDIILEVDGKKVTEDNSLATAVGKKKVGDTISLSVYHKGETKTVSLKLAEYSE